MDDPYFSFCHNWNNKLDCTVFTTIRKYTPSNWKYYQSLHDRVIDIHVKKLVYCQATLRRFRRCRLRDLDKDLISVDTGISPDKSMVLFARFGILPDDDAVILTFQKVIPSEGHDDFKYSQESLKFIDKENRKKQS